MFDIFSAGCIGERGLLSSRRAGRVYRAAISDSSGGWLGGKNRDGVVRTAVQRRHKRQLQKRQRRLRRPHMAQMAELIAKRWPGTEDADSAVCGAR